MISNIEIKYFLSLFVIWEVTVSRILFRNRFVVYSMDVSCFLRESDFLFFCYVSFATLFLPLSKSIRRKLNTKDLLQKYLSARAVKKLTAVSYTHLMHEYMESQGYVLDITDKRMHHEIYLSDARKVAPEKRRTVIRHPIRKIEE